VEGLVRSEAGMLGKLCPGHGASSIALLSHQPRHGVRKLEPTQADTYLSPPTYLALLGAGVLKEMGELESQITGLTWTPTACMANQRRPKDKI
jgi:hypothetical protein